MKIEINDELVKYVRKAIVFTLDNVHVCPEVIFPDSMSDKKIFEICKELDKFQLELGRRPKKAAKK